MTRTRPGRALAAGVLLAAALAACVSRTPARAADSCTAGLPGTAEGWTAALGTADVLGADGFASARVGDAVVWGTGDTTDRAADGTPRWLHNTLLVTRCGQTRRVVPPGGEEFLPDAADGTYWWFEAGMLTDPYRGRLWAFATRVRDGGAGGFTVLGRDLAEIDVTGMGTGGAPRLVRLHRAPGSDTAGGGVSWGAGAYRGGDGWAYVYGTRGVPGEFGSAVRLARAPLGRIAEVTRWRYFTGSGWSTNPAAAADVIAAHGGPESGLAAYREPRTGRTVLVSKQDGPFGDHARRWTAPGPAGPWTVADVAAVPYDDGTSRRYSVRGGPYLPGGQLLLVVIRSPSSGDLDALWTRAYWPELLAATR